MITSVIVPKDALPGFWKFMYRVSPLTYLVDGLLSTGLAHNDVVCSQLELLRFEPGMNATCGQYMEPFVQLAGGRVFNPESNEGCLYCPMATTDAFLGTVSASFDNRWRNYGLMWVYIVFNVAAALGLYWLARVPKRFSMPSIGRGKKA